MLSYRGYTTTLQVNSESRIWYGRIVGIQDVVTFEGKTRMEAEREFRHSVDAYLNFCRAIERIPNQPFSPKSHTDAPTETLRGQDDNFDPLNIY